MEKSSKNMSSVFCVESGRVNIVSVLISNIEFALHGRMLVQIGQTTHSDNQLIRTILWLLYTKNITTVIQEMCQ